MPKPETVERIRWEVRTINGIFHDYLTRAAEDDSPFADSLREVHKLTPEKLCEGGVIGIGSVNIWRSNLGMTYRQYESFWRLMVEAPPLDTAVRRAGFTVSCLQIGLMGALIQTGRTLKPEDPGLGWVETDDHLLILSTGAKQSFGTDPMASFLHEPRRNPDAYKPPVVPRSLQHDIDLYIESGSDVDTSTLQKFYSVIRAAGPFSETLSGTIVPEENPALVTLLLAGLEHRSLSLTGRDLREEEPTIGDALEVIKQIIKARYNHPAVTIQQMLVGIKHSLRETEARIQESRSIRN